MTTFDNIALPITATITGLNMQACAGTLVHEVPALVRAIRNKQPIFFSSVIVSFNFFILINHFLFLPSVIATETTCVQVNYATTVFYHMSMLVFDAFILAKSWMTTRKNRVFLAISVLLVLYRFSWAVADFVLSTVAWNTDLNACIWNQSPLVNFHYDLADIICDAVATLGSLSMLFVGKSVGINGILQKLVNENALRSMVILIVNAVVMYLTQTLTDFSSLLLAWYIQDYIIILLMNAELQYKEERNGKRSKNPNTSTNPETSTRGNERRKSTSNHA
ncbi:hypothetical protein BC830DRAFT_1152621 [Chytriomyces sp. MP71]|nr:hypothetical protein BC830DRAFT_1152621 [Chytriomyces sp. MP71]